MFWRRVLTSFKETSGNLELKVADRRPEHVVDDRVDGESLKTEAVKKF